MSADSPQSWLAAIERIARGEARRTVVIGPTDVGKSSFVGAALGAAASAGAPLSLIDLDPGQKMAGPPGTAALAVNGAVERVVFIGSTSASEIAALSAAASSLARSAPAGFVANTAGFVHGAGARLQTLTIAALQPDLIVAMGDPALLTPIINAHPGIAVAWLDPSELARRKSPSERARIRQAAFAASLQDAELLTLPRSGVSFTPAAPAPFQGLARPVCALSAMDGEVLGLGILVEAQEEIVVFTQPIMASPGKLQLGKMWARPMPSGWQLLERLTPAWQR